MEIVFGIMVLVYQVNVLVSKFLFSIQFLLGNEKHFFVTRDRPGGTMHPAQPARDFLTK